VLFICTANTLETISAALLDRCEVVQLSGRSFLVFFSTESPFTPTGYTYDEKLHIARRFLLPKQLAANGLTPERVQITEPALLSIATRYTREAGVRGLERAVGAVIRFKAVEWAEWADTKRIENEKAPGLVSQHEGDGSEPRLYKGIVEEYELERIHGIAKWDDAEEKDREERRGIVYGLVVMGQGEGGILPVETTAVPGIDMLRLTGSLGDVSSATHLLWMFLAMKLI
jgi:ATP-dependent Lon protease